MCVQVNHRGLYSQRLEKKSSEPFGISDLKSPISNLKPLKKLDTELGGGNIMEAGRAMRKEYTHEELGCEIESVTGHYVVEREEKVEFRGKELLVLLGYGVFDSSCCGEGGCRYALVPGYILKWKTASNEAGKKITEVEPVRDEAERREIERNIKEKETVQQVNFW
jgi:hypothetical protein